MANGKLLRKPALRGVLESVPEDRERGMPLLTVREPVHRLEDVVLAPQHLSLQLNRSCGYRW